MWSSKTAKGQNGSEKSGSWNGLKIHNSFLAYKTSGFVRWRKTIRTRQGATPKVYENAPSIWSPISGVVTKKAKIRYVLNGICENPTFPNLSHILEATFKDPKKAAPSLSALANLWPRNPYKTSTKALWRAWHPDASRGPNPPSERAKWDQIPLLQRVCVFNS